MSGKKIDLIVGDFFTPDENLLEPVDVVWDRASLVAIDPSLREDYVRVIRSWLKPGGKILLSTTDRREGTAEAVAAGPPFSVSEAEVRRLYEGNEWVESVTALEEVDLYKLHPEWKAGFEGVDSM